MSNAVAKHEDPTGGSIGNIVTPFEMLNSAIAKGATPETLTQLMALHERWEANLARKAFDNAMAAAKAEIPVISKNRTVDFTSAKGRTHYRHEDLAEIARTVNPILASHGLSYRFRVTSAINEPVGVTCVISHRDGFSEETTLVGPRDDSGNKNSLQQVGSTLTYLQRMTLKAALGIAASEDDDGKAGGDGPAPTLVSKDQVTRLVNLADEVKADKEKFCKYLKVGSLAEIPAKDFDHAVKLLEAKRGK